MYQYAMAYLTANQANPIKAVEAAASAGYDYISFRLLPAGPGDSPPDLLNDDALFGEVMAAMQHHGISCLDVEMIRINSSTDASDFRSFFERAQRMGARHVLTAVDDPQQARAIHTYGELCILANEYDLSLDLEFMPWTQCKNIRQALQFTEAVNNPAAAILLDTLHFDRSDSSIADLKKIPADQINYVQLCDGPADYDNSDEGLMWLARNKRMIPGRGNIDFPSFLAALPVKPLVFTVEVPDVELAASMGLTHFVHTALQEARALVDAWIQY